MKKVIKYGIIGLIVAALAISVISILGYMNYKSNILQDKQDTLDEIYNITYGVDEPFEEIIGDFDSQGFDEYFDSQGFDGYIGYTYVYYGTEQEFFATDFDGDNGWGVYFYLEEQPTNADNLLLWSVEIFYISREQDKSVWLDFYPDNEFYSQYNIEEWEKRLNRLDYKDIEKLIERMDY